MLLIVPDKTRLQSSFRIFSNRHLPLPQAVVACYRVNETPQKGFRRFFCFTATNYTEQRFGNKAEHAGNEDAACSGDLPLPGHDARRNAPLPKAH